MAATEKKIVVVAKLPTINAQQILRGRTLVLNRDANSSMFTSLVPNSADMKVIIDTYETAEALVENGGLGVANTRNIAKAVFEKKVSNWTAGCQILVNSAPNYLAAIAFPDALGMYVKVNGVFVKPPFELRNVHASILELIKKKVPKSVNEYQISYDKGLTYIGLVSTDLNRMPVGSMTVGAEIICRTRANIGLVAGVWIYDSITITK